MNGMPQNNKTASFDAYRASGKTESLADALQHIDGYVMRVS